MARTTVAKPATTKGKTTVKVQVEEAPRANRYTRSAMIIVSSLSIEAAALSKQADMSLSTARHCLEAWHGITALLKQSGHLTPTFAKQPSGKSQEPAPISTAK
jgi:hypothetical protein